MTAVVTGAGRGLGAGIALALAADGHDVVLGWHTDEDAVTKTAAAVEELGVRAVPVQGDVADRGAAYALLGAAVELGGPDVWVNNAGVSALAPVVKTSVDDLRWMLDVNVVGVFHGLQVAAAWMISDRRKGRIVNIASDLGVRGFPFLGAYAASKFAVVGLTQTAALELAEHGITVNAVCPGTAETDMVQAERRSEMALLGESADAVRQSYLDAIPAGRFCLPDDVGAAVAYLASPAASYVTGQSLCVNGGTVVR